MEDDDTEELVRKLNLAQETAEHLAEEIKRRRDAAKKARRSAEREAQRLAQQRHRDSLEKDNGTWGHPKADMLYSIAWELGHSDGLDSVTSYYEMMVDLIK